MDLAGRPEWAVECYLCKRNVIIVLEDASINGYVTMDKYVSFDEEHCVLLLRSLARLHSRSLVPMTGDSSGRPAGRTGTSSAGTC
ncbi:hypothetical protein EAI_00191 [Harpegnathos saltator]|uniref:Uncharacterized protein n=1 Tax=Harpegnathos saltator TaxID=610380 RepID=E2BP66_HARSA|nr:hypothetical protein EAI_00191 [Harpegnathos saltator]